MRQCGLSTSSVSKTPDKFGMGTKMEQSWNLVTDAHLVLLDHFHPAQSWNKVCFILHSKFVLDLRLEQDRNKVSQKWNIIGTMWE